MREILRSGALSYRSLATDPQLLLGASMNFTRPNYGALGTRFTVQYNLFAGSIVALGTDAQREELYATQATGQLGCFAFTELGAGVMSGAGAEATATYDPATDSFDIHSPTPSSTKTWISQGLYAEHAVIMANLLIPEATSNADKDKNKNKDNNDNVANGVTTTVLKNHGPHLFFSRIQTYDGRGVFGKMTPLPGVTVSSLPQKASLPGLDNAYIKFDHFKVKRTQLLSRFSAVSEKGVYSFSPPQGVTRMLDLLITRLLTGRVCLSEYSIALAQRLCRDAYSYAATRELWRGKKPAGEIMATKPLLRNMFTHYAHSLDMVAHYIKTVRFDVAQCIRDSRFPAHIIDAVGVCKFVGTSFAVDSISVLRKGMGARALLEESGLGAGSFVCNATCAAEGDNTIMELKLVGDLFKGGFTRLFPLLLLLRLVWRSAVGRRAVSVYCRKVLYAFWLHKAALQDGQLLRDIAWARAHLLILDCWQSSSSSSSSSPDQHPQRRAQVDVQHWMESYETVLMRFPTPAQF
jgi:acyl-CoA oxidase